MLSREMSLAEVLRSAGQAEREPRSRFRFGSPCKLVRTIDMLVHLVIPELLEDRFPRISGYLRRTSPRWGRSWRRW